MRAAAASRYASARADEVSGWDRSFHMANSLGTRSVFKRDAPITVRESSLSSPGFRSRRASHPLPNGFVPAQVGRARPGSAGAGARPPLDSIALLQMAAAQRLAAANAQLMASANAPARPAHRTSALSLTFPPNFPHGARPTRSARSAGGSRAPPPLASAGRASRGGVSSAGAARPYSDGRLEPAPFSAARDSLARDGELLEARIAELRAETAREQAEAKALGARARMQALAEAEVEVHLAALKTALATVSADVRQCGAERAAASQVAARATAAAARAVEPAALGPAEAAAVAARRARAHASIRALGPAIGSFVAWADELGLADDDDDDDGGADGGGADGAAAADGGDGFADAVEEQGASVAPLVASARALLLEVDGRLRTVSEVQRAAQLLERARGARGGATGGAADDGEGGMLGNAMVLTPEGRAVPAREVLLRMPPALPAAGPDADADALRRRASGGGGRPPDRAARRAAKLDAGAGAAAEARLADGAADSARRSTSLPTMLAELHAVAEEASVLAAHVRALGGQRDGLARAQSFRQLDRDGDGFLNDAELAQLPAALGLPPFLLARLRAGALGLGAGGSQPSLGGGVELAAAAAQRDALLSAMGAGARAGFAGAACGQSGVSSGVSGVSGVRLSPHEFGALCDWLLGPTALARNLALWFRALDMDGDGVLSGGDVLAAFEAAAASGAATAPPGARALGSAAWRPLAEGLVRKLLAAKAGGAAGARAGAGGARGRLLVPLSELFRDISVATVFARDAVGALRRLLGLRPPEGEEEEEEEDGGDEGAPPLTSRST